MMWMVYLIAYGLVGVGIIVGPGEWLGVWSTIGGTASGFVGILMGVVCVVLAALTDEAVERW